MSNFADILKKRASDVEAPKPLPVGTYICLVTALPEFAKMGKNETDVANYTLRVIQAGEDVDPDAYREATKGRETVQIKHRFFLTEDAIYRLKNFLVDDLQIEEDGKTLGELIQESAGRQVRVSLKHRPSQDGTQIYSEVSGTAPV